MEIFHPAKTCRTKRKDLLFLQTNAAVKLKMVSQSGRPHFNPKNRPGLYSLH